MVGKLPQGWTCQARWWRGNPLPRWSHTASLYWKYWSHTASLYWKYWSYTILIILISHSILVLKIFILHSILTLERLISHNILTSKRLISHSIFLLKILISQSILVLKTLISHSIMISHDIENIDLTQHPSIENSLAISQYPTASWYLKTLKILILHSILAISHNIDDMDLIHIYSILKHTIAIIHSKYWRCWSHWASLDDILQPFTRNIDDIDLTEHPWKIYCNGSIKSSKETFDNSLSHKCKNFGNSQTRRKEMQILFPNSYSYLSCCSYLWASSQCVQYLYVSLKFRAGYLHLSVSF